MVDVNVNLGRWPLRRLRFDDTAGLAAMLRSQGVTRAWAGSFECLLHKDMAAANARLAADCRREGTGLLLPFGSVNPMLPEWEEDFRRCVEEHRMPGLRLHPNYHGYTLHDPVFTRLLGMAAKKGLVVELALIMEDERMMHPLLRVPPTDPAPLAGVVKRIPGLKLVIVNGLRTLRDKALAEVVSAGDVSVEIGMLDALNGVGDLVAALPEGRVLFGSYAPLFYFESAALKLQESPLADAQLRAVRYESAKRLLPAFA
ncbi:MAG: metal-dependent hydrolase [Candidatus Aminicenantes bacterium RBG_16_63_16]|nr:MAG: metal-dependent hydrolase [Candidatus Aminicenantes bacterium RBG_16_63_16]